MTTFTDDFNRADSSNLGAGWVEVSGDWSIVSNQLSSGNAGGTIILRAAGALATDDNNAQVTIAATAAASQGVWCRGNSNITSGYLWRNNGTSWDLFSVVGGSFTALATFAAAAAPGDVAKVEAIGTAIKAYVNGTQRASVTNSDVTTGTSVGIRADSVNALRFDDFSAADAGGATINGTIDGSFGGLGGGITATVEVPATIGQAYGGLSGGVSGTREVIAAVSQGLGALGGGLVAVVEVSALVGQSFGGLGGGLSAVRETLATIAFAGGSLGGGITVPGDPGGEIPTTTQVTLAWLRQFAGAPDSATQLPEPESWMDTGWFAVVAGVVGGNPGLYVPDHGPVVQIEVYAAARAATGAKSTSRKIPRGTAESKLNGIVRQSYVTPAGLDLTLPAFYRPVWIETIYPVSEVRELPDPSPNYARYSVDMFVGWIERDPVG